MNKRQTIISVATILFSEQGFDGTTTLQIGQAAEVSEPAVFYHFKNKSDLFATIIDAIFSEYFTRLDALDSDTATEFEKIQQLIELHLDLVREMPTESYLVVSACPTKLRNSAHICTRNIEEQRDRLHSYLSTCLRRGIQTGEFYDVPIKETTRLIIALLNGLMRQEILYPADPAADPCTQNMNMHETAVAFCRRSLVKTARGKR